MRSSLRAFPFGSRYPLYLFCSLWAKKDAASIPNAAFKISFRPNKKITVNGSISFNDSNKVKSDKQNTIVNCKLVTRTLRFKKFSIPRAQYYQSTEQNLP